MCATLHNHTMVKQGELIGATRAIPLTMKRVAIKRAAASVGVRKIRVTGGEPLVRRVVVD